MSTNHHGNLLNEITFEEHDGSNNAKRVTLISGSTIFAVVNTGAGAGNVTLDPGSRTGILGNLTIDSGNISLKGNVTLDVGSLVGIRGNLTITDSKAFIGLVSVSGFANPMPVLHAGAGNVTLSDSKGFVGLVTAISINGGANKTFIPKTLAFAQASIVTIAVPTGTFKVTNIVLNSNATTRINIKSGATYLTGNVSLGMTLFPGGGFVQNGSPDSPTFIGLAAQAAIVLEKFDTGGIISQIGGHLLYFDE